jgi:hypothetical protein
VLPGVADAVGAYTFSALATIMQTVASLLGIILALWGIQIAATAARDQRANRSFGSDKAAADDFEETLQELRVQLGQVMGSGKRAESTLGALSTARMRYTSAVKDMTLNAYLNMREQQLYLIVARGPRDPQLFENQQIVHDATEGMRVIVRNWTYPERRRDVLSEIYSWMIDHHYEPGALISDRVLQIDTWLLTSDPAPTPALRKLHSMQIWWRTLFHDARSGHLRDRYASWRLGRAETRRARANYGPGEKTRADGLDRT